MFNQDSKTRQEIRQLQKLLKKSPMLFARLGECYLQVGDWEHAEKVLRKGLEQNPDYTTGLLILGEGYLYNGLYRDAEECAKKGLENEPSHLGLLRLLEKIKRLTEEIGELEKVRTSLKTLDPLAILDEHSDTFTEEKLEESAEVSETGSTTGEDTPEESKEPLETRSEAEIEEFDKSSEEIPVDDSVKDLDLDRIAAEAESGTDVKSEETEEKLREVEEPISEKEVSEETEEIADTNLTPDETGETAPISEEIKIEETEEPASNVQDNQKIKNRGKKQRIDKSEDITGEITPEIPDQEVKEKPARRKKKIATKTLGELYATQKKYDEAIEIYEKLSENDPSNGTYRERLEELKSRREAIVSENAE